MASLRHYQALFTKTASEEPPDQAQVANAEHAKNFSDQRETLKGLFDYAQMTEKEQGRQIRSLFDRAGGQAYSGNPLLKLASAAVASDAELQGWLSQESSAYKQVVQRSFADEVEKIASLLQASGRLG